MIARMWRGVTSAEQADEYLAYLMKTGIKDYRAVPGNRGGVRSCAAPMRGRQSSCSSLVFESYEAIRAFAGEDIERAVYYSKDKAFLLELEPKVTHYDCQSPPRRSRRRAFRLTSGLHRTSEYLERRSALAS